MRVYKVTLTEYWYGSFGDRFDSIIEERLFVNESDRDACAQHYKENYSDEDYEIDTTWIEVELCFEVSS